MARSLSFRQRRLACLAITAGAFASVALVAWIEQSRLGRASLITGVTTLTCLVGLMLIGLRRRLPVLPLGSVSSWTQVHLYMGLFTAGVYWLHVPTLIADGLFEGTLSVLFLSVTCSGLYGLYASRRLPRKLTAIEGELRFDRVDWDRTQIAQAATELLTEIAPQPAGDVLRGFYEQNLQPFFQSRPSLAFVLVPGGGRRRKLLDGLKNLDRYLERESRQSAGKFAALVRRRDDLDYQFALQLRLRLWLVFHSTLSIALMVAAILHATVAWRFSH